MKQHELLDLNYLVLVKYFLQHLNEEIKLIHKKLNIHSFYETLLTVMILTLTIIVLVK